MADSAADTTQAAATTEAPTTTEPAKTEENITIDENASKEDLQKQLVEVLSKMASVEEERDAAVARATAAEAKLTEAIVELQVLREATTAAGAGAAVQDEANKEKAKADLAAALSSINKRQKTGDATPATSTAEIAAPATSGAATYDPYAAYAGMAGAGATAWGQQAAAMPGATIEQSMATAAYTGASAYGAYGGAMYAMNNNFRSSDLYTPRNAPCSTLFVSCGPPPSSFGFTTENDLKALFGQYPGFERLHLSAKGTCFVSFIDENTATACMNAVQGLILPMCAERGPIRIDFAKSAMGGGRRPGAGPRTPNLQGMQPTLTGANANYTQ